MIIYNYLCPWTHSIIYKILCRNRSGRPDDCPTNLWARPSLWAILLTCYTGIDFWIKPTNNVISTCCIDDLLPCDVPDHQNLLRHAPLHGDVLIIAVSILQYINKQPNLLLQLYITMMPYNIIIIELRYIYTVWTGLNLWLNLR